MPTRAPHSLRCEYATDPIGLGTKQPRFFWQLDDDRPDAAQTGYRILVASSEERLARDEGDLWDSGEVGSEEHAQIVSVLKSPDDTSLVKRVRGGVLELCKQFPVPVDE